MKADSGWSSRFPLSTWRDIVILGTLLIIVWKIAGAQLVIQPDAFPISDILTLVLALFAMGLSALFYFKATEAANRFYNDSHQFTREVAEILGRIEAGFGERLRHLDEGYSSMRDHVMDARRGIKQEEGAVEEIEEQREKLLQELAERAELQEGERASFFERLGMMDRELEYSRREVDRLRGELVRSTSEIEAKVQGRVMRYARARMLPKFEEKMGKPLERAARSEIEKAFGSSMDGVPPVFLRDLNDLGYLTDEGTLSQRGVQFLRALAGGDGEEGE